MDKALLFQPVNPVVGAASAKFLLPMAERPVRHSGTIIPPMATARVAPVTRSGPTKRHGFDS